MSALVFLLVVLALAKGGSFGHSLVHAAKAAQDDARQKREVARRTGDPLDHAAAQEATTKAASLTRTARSAASTPAPWPQATPKGLPPFPGGWELDVPPPLAVQSRAAQLLPTLWGRGAGATKTEKTAGRWITYQAQKMGTKKGVVAFRVKADAMAPTSMAV
jgi:hypothetical protein